MTPAQAIAKWTPRIEWPDLWTATLVALAREHVREHQASQAAEHHIPDELVHKGSTCARKAVINFVRSEYSNYGLLIERYPQLRTLARERINEVIAQHYLRIPCGCRRCPPSHPPTDPTRDL